MGNHFAKINVADKNKTLKEAVYPEINFIEDPVDTEVLQDDDHPEESDSKNVKYLHYYIYKGDIGHEYYCKHDDELKKRLLEERA